MFWKKNCKFCNYKINKDWKFCPNCGSRINDSEMFEKIIEDIEREFEKSEKAIKMDLDKEPFFRTGSLHITVQSGTGIEPRIEIKTTGDYKNLEPEIKRKFGIIEKREDEVKKRKIKITEEPEVEKKTEKNKVILKIHLPGVKNEGDIEVKKFEQSIEVKAFAEDKAYFKVIPVPENAIINKKFKDEILEIEIER